jgi:hypothetical protein
MGYALIGVRIHSFIHELRNDSVKFLGLYVSASRMHDACRVYGFIVFRGSGFL